MKMSPKGRALLIQREGFRLKAYRDTKGIWTIGVGHTSAAGKPFVTPGMVITKAEVDSILAQDLVQFEEAVRGSVHVSLSQGQFDALVSLAFNIGAGGFRKSTVVRQLNAGNYRAAADAFLMWNKPPEILGRRKAERKQFLDATPAGAPGAPVRFIPANNLHDDEHVGPAYLRAAGSRIIAASDSIKKTAATIGVGDALATASQLRDYASQAHDIASGFEHGAPARELLDTYWPVFLGLGATALVGVLAFLIWDYARRIERARVEDAVFVNEGD